MKSHQMHNKKSGLPVKMGGVGKKAQGGFYGNPKKQGQGSAYKGSRTGGAKKSTNKGY